MGLKYKGLSVGMFAMNTYVLWCDKTGIAALIDPGDEIERIGSIIENEKLRPEKIILTHAHIDHILQAKTAQDKWGLPLYMHEEDLPLLQNMRKQFEMLGFMPASEVSPPRVDGFLRENDSVEIGEQSLKVLHGPGHSPGSIMLLSDEIVVVGDVLFQGSIGRTDLAGGSYETLIRTIREKLLVLDDSMRVLPGHGDETTIGAERHRNPFLQF